jgi:transcriptional regulator with XRE-family HTH domain
MTSNTVRLLRAAADVVGGEKALARELGISEKLLSRFMADFISLPDPLFLRAVDIVLDRQQSELRLAVVSPARSPEDPAT